MKVTVTSVNLLSNTQHICGFLRTKADNTVAPTSLHSAITPHPMIIEENTLLTKLGRLIEQISDLDSTEEIYHCIVKNIPDFLPADHVTITHYGIEDKHIAILAMHNADDVSIDAFIGEKMISFTSYQAYAQSVATPIIYQPSDNLDRKINLMLHNAGMVSVLIVPLISGLEIVGTINIASKHHQYQKEDKFRLEKISALLATSITHTVAFRSNGQVSRQRLYAKHLEYLNVLSENLLAAETVSEALRLVAICATDLANARRVSFCELDTDPNFVKIVGLVDKGTDTKGTRVPLHESGLEDSLIHGKKKYNTDLLNSKNRAHRSLGKLGYNHIWSFPIICKSQPRRCLNITSQGTELHIDDAMSVLNTLARLANSTLERIRVQQQNVKQAKTDPLTGLCNRKEFNEQLNRAIEKSTTDDDTCLMYLDLDLFKNINDSMGHAIGDQVLVEVSHRMQAILDDSDTLARIGGDEFIVLLTNMTNRESVESLAKQFIKRVREPFNISTQELTLGVSIGICNYPQHGSTADDLIKNSDIAMYKAKEKGRNQYHLFDQKLANELSYRLQLQKDLITALEKDQLSLVYQPQFDMHTLEAHCVEVLLRWHHHTHGMIPPDVFIPLAENCGMISSVTDWVLNHALADMVEWQKSFPSLTLAVNISAVEFSPRLNLLNRLTKALDTYKVDAKDLEIELTETAFLKYPEHASELAKQLSDVGISIALDDFGTGYASLTYLVQLPIDCIKIDRSFVDGVEYDPRKQAVVNGIVAISKGLNVSCLGEGVETPDQFAWMSQAGCNSVQGYLLSKPVSAECLPAAIAQVEQQQPKAA